MKKPILNVAIATGILAMTSSIAAAGPIQSACLSSGRAASNNSLCSCIQQAADMTLAGRDQKRAAKFFRDPEMAHAVWTSKKPADDAFWTRYKAFGDMAQSYCGG